MDADFQKRLLATFQVETKEHLAAISAGLIELEKAGAENRQTALEAVSREAHSLKGAARAVNMAGIESVSHALEGVFAALKRQSDLPPPELFDLLHQAVDVIDRLLAPAENGGETVGKTKIRELVTRLDRTAKGLSPSSSPPAFTSPEPRELPPPERAATTDTVRISAGKLDSVLHQTEELLAAKLAARQRSSDLGGMGDFIAHWNKEWRKMRPSVQKMRKAHSTQATRGLADADSAPWGKALEFLDWNQAFLKDLEHKIHGLAKAAANDHQTLSGMVDTLLDETK